MGPKYRALLVAIGVLLFLGGAHPPPLRQRLLRHILDVLQVESDALHDPVPAEPRVRHLAAEEIHRVLLLIDPNYTALDVGVQVRLSVAQIAKETLRVLEGQLGDQGDHQPRRRHRRIHNIRNALPVPAGGRGWAN